MPNRGRSGALTWAIIAVIVLLGVAVMAFLAFADDKYQAKAQSLTAVGTAVAVAVAWMIRRRPAPAPAPESLARPVAAMWTPPPTEIQVEVAQVVEGVLELAAVFPSREHNHVFIDTTNDGSGFQLAKYHLGCNYMLENERFYWSAGPAWDDWRESGSRYLVSQRGTRYQWRLPLSALASQPLHQVTVVFHASTGGAFDVYGEPLEVAVS